MSYTPAGSSPYGGYAPGLTNGRSSSSSPAAGPVTATTAASAGGYGGGYGGYQTAGGYGAYGGYATAPAAGTAAGTAPAAPQQQQQQQQPQVAPAVSPYYYGQPAAPTTSSVRGPSAPPSGLATPAVPSFAPPPPQQQQQQQYYQQQPAAPAAAEYPGYSGGYQQAPAQPTAPAPSAAAPPGTAALRQPSPLPPPVSHPPSQQQQHSYPPPAQQQQQQQRQPQSSRRSDSEHGGVRRDGSRRDGAGSPALSRSTGGGGGGGAPRRHPRPPPDRYVAATSSPTPARDIPHPSVPTEVPNSAKEKHLSAVDFVGIDDGNASPKFFRLTESAVPTDQVQVKDTLIPFGAAVAPLCRPLHSEEVVPVVRDRPPVRCCRCRGYLSCHAKFIEGGWKWSCALCGMVNAVDPKVFANLDMDGHRVDRNDKAELCLGSVEYCVDSYPEYQLRNDKDEVLPTRPLHHLFFIDVSAAAARSFLPAYVEALEESIGKMAETTPQCRVSFVTYASQLHFYNFRDRATPQFIVPDVDNPFVPLPFSSLCWLEAGRDLDIIRTFLARVTTISSDLGETECVVGAAVQVAMLVFAGQHGGRAIISAHCHPQKGIGAIKPREQHKLYGTDREKELLRPIEGFWTTTAAEAARQQISFDLFLFPSDFCEVVTLSHVSHVTNGCVFLFPNYDPQVDGTKVRALMGQVCTEEAGYAGILRVRCSNNLRVKKYHGHFYSQNVNDMDLACIGGSSTFFVDFAHEGNLEKNSNVHFQVALLYTTRGGSRRVRVQSVRATTTAGLSSIYHGCDLEAVLLGMLHEGLSLMMNKGSKTVAESLKQRLINVLVAYRRFGSKESPRLNKSLLLPSKLKLLIVFIVCLCKSDAVSEGTTVRLDARIHSVYELMSMPMHKLLSYLYPALFCLNRVALPDSRYGRISEATGLCVLPPREQLVYDSITTDGAYALCDEQALVVYLWIGNDVAPETSQALFGCPDPRAVCRPGGPGTEAFSEGLQNVLYALTLRDDGMRRLVVVHEGERAEDAFFTQFKEEATDARESSYDKFLSHVHNKIREALM